MPEAIQSVPLWMMIAGFLLVLGPLVTLHEFGHYLVGRWFGVKAEVFSVGFGKELVGRTDKRGTCWRISAIPLGGYVQFKGDMSPASQPDPNLSAEELDGAFQTRPLWQKSLIVAAGPLTNLFIAVAIFAAFFMAYGKPFTPAVIEGFAEQSPAQEAGLMIGDRITAVDGTEIEDFDALRRAILPYPGRTVSVTYEREGETASLPMTIADLELVDRFGNESRIGRIGVGSESIVFEPIGPLSAVGEGFVQSFGIMRMMVTGIGQIITGERSVTELGGPIKIAKYSGEQLSLGPLPFIEFVALISINLAFINLLPIPALDGGHLAFYAAEAVRRKPASARSQEWAYRTGVAFVLALMLFVTIIDIASLPIFGS